jgi:hypothetical protein
MSDRFYFYALVVDKVRNEAQFARMPEDDRFSKCMGKGYKGAYLHARDGRSEVAVARTLGKGISHQMKSGALRLDALAPIISTLERALADVSNRRGELFHPIHDVRVSFHQALDRILIQNGAGTSTRALCDAARQTFEQLQHSDQVEAPRVLAGFCDKLTRTLTDHHCFAVPVNGVTAREEIMRKTHRDDAAQVAFEHHVATALVPVVEGLVKQALRSEDGKPHRTPPLPKPLPRFDLAEMDQPLAEA